MLQSSFKDRKIPIRYRNKMSNIITSDVNDVELDPKSLIDESDNILMKDKSKMLQAIKDLDTIIEQSSVPPPANNNVIDNKFNYTIHIMCHGSGNKFSINCDIVNMGLDANDSELLKIAITTKNPDKLLKLVSFYMRENEKRQKQNSKNFVRLIRKNGTGTYKKKKKFYKNHISIIGMYAKFNDVRVNLVDRNTTRYRIIGMHYGIENNKPICNLSCIRHL